MISDIFLPRRPWHSCTFHVTVIGAYVRGDSIRYRSGVYGIPAGEQHRPSGFIPMVFQLERRGEHSHFRHRPPCRHSARSSYLFLEGLDRPYPEKAKDLLFNHCGDNPGRYRRILP
jgi:hypothetical protein